MKDLKVGAILCSALCDVHLQLDSRHPDNDLQQSPAGLKMPLTASDERFAVSLDFVCSAPARAPLLSTASFLFSRIYKHVG